MPFPFDELVLQNRLGQKVQLQVANVTADSRDYVFALAPKRAVSSLVAKNAEYFASQLLLHFDLRPNRFDLIELRPREESAEWWRWRFQWVGSTPLDGRCQPVKSAAQQARLAALSGLNVSSDPRIAQVWANSA